MYQEVQYPELISDASCSSFVCIDKLLNAYKWSSSGKRKEEIVLAATTAWIVEENQPLNAISKKSFWFMVKTIDKSCPVMTRENVQDDIMYLGTICWKAIQRELKGKHFSLTTDHWTSSPQTMRLIHASQHIGLRMARYMVPCWHSNYFMVPPPGLNWKWFCEGIQWVQLCPNIFIFPVVAVACHHHGHNWKYEYIWTISQTQRCDTPLLCWSCSPPQYQTCIHRKAHSWWDWGSPQANSQSTGLCWRATITRWFHLSNIFSIKYGCSMREWHMIQI